jgi:hypothetical protein
MGGGSTSYRPTDGNIARCGDMLPTPELLAALKAAAWDAAQAKAFALGWPVGAAGLAVIQMAPVVAMRALNQIIPAPVGKLASWLRVDHAEASAGWNLAQSNAWVGETAAAIVAVLEGRGHA